MTNNRHRLSGLFRMEVQGRKKTDLDKLLKLSGFTSGAILHPVGFLKESTVKKMVAYFEGMNEVDEKTSKLVDLLHHKGPREETIRFFADRYKLSTEKMREIFGLSGQVEDQSNFPVEEPPVKSEPKAQTPATPKAKAPVAPAVTKVTEKGASAPSSDKLVLPHDANDKIDGIVEGIMTTLKSQIDKQLVTLAICQQVLSGQILLPG